MNSASTFALKVGYLSAIDVFRDLPKSDIQRLAETTTMIRYARGQVIYHPGECNAALLLIKMGRVQIVRESADGRRLILATLGSETFFAEMALIGQRSPRTLPPRRWTMRRCAFCAAAISSAWFWTTRRSGCACSSV